jgi:hypothetical protein
MLQRHGFGGGGGELRVSLPRVGGPAPAPLTARRGRGGPAGWVVPLPAALLLLALLAVVFQYQLLQCINEADKLVRPRRRLRAPCECTSCAALRACALTRRELRRTWTRSSVACSWTRRPTTWRRCGGPTQTS